MYIVTRTFTCWYICALVLPSHSFSILDHSLCAYGYSEVLVVVAVCSVSMGSIAVARDMVSIESGGGGAGVGELQQAIIVECLPRWNIALSWAPTGI